MGEYADMMLDGTCCQQCGEFMGGDEGYAVTCAGCGGNDWEREDDLVIEQKQGENLMDYVVRLKNHNRTNKQIASITGLTLRSLKRKITAHNKERDTTPQPSEPT